MARSPFLPIKKTLATAMIDIELAAMPDVLADMDSSNDVMELVREKVERGELGAKTGKGFYDWTPESAEAARRKMAQAFIEIEKWSQPGH